MNVGVHVSFQSIVFSTHMPRSGIVGWYSCSIFSFLRNHHTVLHSAVSIYIPTNSVGGFPFLHTLSSIYFLTLLRELSLKKIFIFIICFWLCWVFVAVWAFSLQRTGTTNFGAQASRCGEQALGCVKVSSCETWAQ